MGPNALPLGQSDIRRPNAVYRRALLAGIWKVKPALLTLCSRLVRIQMKIDAELLLEFR